MIEFDRLVAVVNPVSSQARKALPRIDALRQQFPYAGYEQIETSIESERTQEDIRNKTIAGDICLVLGGDGTFHDAMQAVIASEVPLLPLWAGNGNDISHMLNGNPPLIHNMHELLQEGEAISIHPIELSFSGLQTRLAASYAGFGFMAEGAARVNDGAYRQRRGYHIRPLRALYEVQALSRLPFTHDVFTYSDNAVFTRQASDLTFANGNRIAKYGRPSARLEQPGIARWECESRDHAAAWLARLVLGKTRSHFIGWGDSYTFEAHQAIRGHVDAEAFELPPHTAVRVSAHAESFWAISTKLIQ